MRGRVCVVGEYNWEKHLLRKTRWKRLVYKRAKGASTSSSVRVNRRKEKEDEAATLFGRCHLGRFGQRVSNHFL